jgi:hypothetical protein
MEHPLRRFKSPHPEQGLIRSDKLIESFIRQGGSHYMASSSQPNPDDDDIFGDHVYLSVRNIEGGIPIRDRTEPVACSTSMAVARQLMRNDGEDYTIVRVLKTDMPPEAFRILTEHDRMMEVSPEYRSMIEKNRSRSREHLAKKA